MTLCHIRLNSLPGTLWKNGAGITRLLIERPEWRLSVATISRVAPFSSFPGLFRQMGLLAGNGVRLLPTSDTLPLVLGQLGDLIQFDGTLPLTGMPLDGPVEVLNLMRPVDRNGPNLITITPGNPPAGSLRGFIPVTGEWNVLTHQQHDTLAYGDVFLSELPFKLTILKPGQIAYGIS
ncbi:MULTISPECIES: HutD family protein [Gluconobacter]|uniref:HutD family protein n=1 Tax=Gluconobacter cadivus TaxID=2728101 RepID=A0ABR9YY17_9PROT|nr:MULTISPECIES: HutD family protein [Gluconobacter]MBF0889439.1 HutD family protein [Gluconobacter cadivus]MBS1061040.1 HutD family protein [Gluconobacter sp. Dm-44]